MNDEIKTAEPVENKDNVLAREVRAAIQALNDALSNAQAHGLVVELVLTERQSITQLKPIQYVVGETYRQL